ncbi:MAG: HEAT repeat domain-containing protein [Phycisphaerae bacterium]
MIDSARAVAAATVLALLASGCSKDTTAVSPAERVRKTAAISNEQPRGGGKVLVRALTDPNPDVRKAALLGLSGYIAPEHRRAIEQATRDQHPEVRAGAATTLSLYKDDAAAETLGKLLSRDANEVVRLAAASGLGLNPSQKAIVSLLENAEKNPSPRARYQAMRALLSKLGLRFYRKVDPRGGREWRALVEEMKHSRIVREAYASCGASLVHHPEDKKPNAPGHSP